MDAREQGPSARDRRRRDLVGVIAALLAVAGFFVAESSARRPVVVALDAALALVAVVVGALTSRRAPQRAVVRVLGFAPTAVVPFVGTWIWLSRDATLIGEGYEDSILVVMLYLAGAIAFVVALAPALFAPPSLGDARWLRRAGEMSLALLVLVALAGTQAVARRPHYERWLTSLPLRADLGDPTRWPAESWSPDPTSGDHRDLRVDGQHLRVYRDRSGGWFAGTRVCWLGPSHREPAAAGAIAWRRCSRPNRELPGPLRVRRDAERGLWIVDLGNRFFNASFTDRGARVGPTYASILSSAAPPAWWVVAAWIGALFAVALLRWPRPRLDPGAPRMTPYREGSAPVGAEDPARLREATAVTLCALQAAPLAAYFLRAALG